MANLVQIEKYLKQKKLPYKVINLGAEIFTVAGVVESGVDEKEVVKTLIIRYQPNSSPGLEKGYLALALRGNDRVDFRKVRKLFSNKVELAKEDEVDKVAKVPIGAVCPILLDIPVYIDKKVLDLKHINMGSGDLTKGLEMELADLLEAIGSYRIEKFSSVS